jgi:hypothetical protein
MAYEMKDMSGSAFHNSRRDRETSPDLTGSALIHGKEHWVNMWLKTDKNGNTWVSFNLKEKQPKQQESEPPKSKFKMQHFSEITASDLTNDDIPF